MMQMRFIARLLHRFAYPYGSARGQVLWHIGMLLAVGNALGGWVGSHYAVKKGERLIRIVFHAALVVMAVKLLAG